MGERPDSFRTCSTIQGAGNSGQIGCLNSPFMALKSHMAFIRYVSETELPANQRVPDRDNILQIHGVHPHVMRQHYELYLELMHRPGPLSRRHREMLGVRVSALNGCHY